MAISPCGICANQVHSFVIPSRCRDNSCSHGEIDQALGYLSEAAQLAEDIGLPGEVRWIQAELGEMYQHRGSQEIASQAFARACEVLLSLADKLEEEQRTTFLSAEPARWVLERARLRRHT